MFGFFDRVGKYVEVLFIVSKRIDLEGVIIGVFCFFYIVSVEL